MRRRRQRGSAALFAALAAVAVSAALGAAVAELTRTELILTQNRQAAAAALTATDTCLTAIVAALAPGWDFDSLLAGPDGVRGTRDDGEIPAPDTCRARVRAAPGPSDPPRAVLVLAAGAGGGRHALEAVVGRASAPGVSAPLWLGEPLPPGAIAGALALDGGEPIESGAGGAGLAAPARPDVLDRWLAAEAPHLVLSAGTEPPITALPPPIDQLAARLQAAGPVGVEALVPVFPADPALAFVTGDLVVTGALTGSGLLFVEGTLDIRGTLDFTGVVVASRGVRVGSGGQLTVTGALWVGTGAAGGPALAVEGSASLRRDRPAIDAADRLLPLPRPVAVLGLRDVG